MLRTLTFSETIFAMFQLGILVALWGIYSEVRRIVARQGGKER